MNGTARLRWLKVLLPLIALSLATIYLVRTFDSRTLGIAIGDLDWLQLVLIGVPLILLAIAIRTARWWWLLIDNHARISSLPRLYLVIGMSIGLGTVTPVQSGEALKLWLTQRDLNTSIAEATAIHFLERIIDVFVLAALTSVALLFMERTELSTIGAIGLVGIFIMAVIIFLGHRLSIAMPQSIKIGIAAISSVIRRPGRLLPLLFLTTVGWIVVALLWATAFAAAGVTPLSMAEIFAIVGLVTFATILSLVPGGLGVSEASAAALLLSFGSPPEIVLAGAISLRLVGVMTMGLGVVFWLLRELWSHRDTKY